MRKIVVFLLMVSLSLLAQPVAVAPLDPIPEDGTKTLQNQMFTQDTTELWYSFNGVPGRQVGFGGYYATGDTAPARVGYQLFCGDTLLKSGEGDGLTVLDHGFYIQMTENGTHYLRLYATGIEGNKNRFRLIFHIEDTPEQGDITDPYFSGAHLGKWTMDMAAALAAAQANGKDVVVYVGAVTWCPYCMKMERNLVESAAFREWAAENAYLVMVENRRRLNPSYMDGNLYGTSLLVDDSPGGYLEENGLTLAQGEAKIQENISTTLESLLEPVGSMGDAKPICYPTLIYRRGTDGSIVGYFSNNDGAFTPPAGSAYIVVSAKLTNPGEMEKFYQFQTLVADAGENINNYDAETNPSELNNGVSPMGGMFIGGVDERDWFGFTVESGLERWSVTAAGEAAESVRLEIFAVNGDGSTGELVASGEGTLSSGAQVRWVASGKAGQQCRVRVTAPDAAEPVAYSLSWERTENVQADELAQLVPEWAYGSGWTELTTADAATTIAMKQAAYAYNRPLLVYLSKPNSQCTDYCKPAWLNALCDGVFAHEENCVPTDAVYGDYPIKGWSAEKRVLTAVVKEDALRDALMSNYGVTDYPVVAVLHVKDTADLTSSDLKNDEVDVVAVFSFRRGKTVKGVKISNPPQFSNFAAIIETYFPNNCWASMDAVAPLDPIPEDGTKTLQNQMFTQDTTELWYSFNGVPGRQVGFGGYYATGDTAPARVGYQLFCGDTLLKSGEGDGLTVLDHGFYIQMTESGTHYLRLYATGIEGNRNRFRLIFHIEDTPEQGDITDPYYSGAHLGKWTMDMDAALAAAQANGKDVVVYVGAVTWCPYCMKMERNLVESAAFREWAAENAYLVHVENRRRLTPAYMDGNLYGTSLLVDDSPGGYLENNGLTLAQGEAKIQENISTTLESLLEPVGSMGDAKPICYPTLIYRRGTDGSIVGYFSNNDGAFTPPAGSAYIVVSAKLTNPGEMEKFYQFQTLVADAGENINNYDAETDPSELNNGVSPMGGMFIGGVDERDWFGFTVESDLERWSVTATGEAAENVRLEIFAVNGDGSTGELVASGEGTLSSGAQVRWVASGKAGQQCRVRVTAPDAAEPVAYSLSWERTENVQTEVSFDVESIELAQSMETATVSVSPVNYGEPLDGMTVSFEIVNDTEMGIALEADELSWTAEERAAGVAKELAIQLDNMSLEAWDGAMSFVVRIVNVEGTGAVAGATSQLTADVYSKPAFTVDSLDMTDLTVNVRSVQTLMFHNGLPGVLTWSAKDASATRAVELIMPPKWMTVTLEPEEGTLRIDALPTEIDEGKFTLELVVTNGDVKTVSEKVLVTYRVSDMDDINAFGHGHDFAGYFYQASGVNRLVRGRLHLSADDEGKLTLSYSCAYGAGEQLEGNWTGRDDATGTLTTEFHDGEATIALSLDRDGVLSGTYESPDGALGIAGGLVAESVSLADGYYAFMQDSRGKGYAGGVLTLSRSGDAWTWNVSMPGFNGGDSSVEFMGTAAAAAAIVFACDDVHETSFGGVFELKAHPEVLPEDYYELYQLSSPEKVLACLSGLEVDQGYVASGTEAFGGTMADRLALNTHDFWLTLSPMAGVEMAVPVGVILTEDAMGNMAGDGGVYGAISLVKDDAQGCLTGEATVYVNDDEGATTIQQATMTLEVVPMEQDCCATDARPVAAGYYVLPDGRSGFAALYGPHNDAIRPPMAATPMRLSDSVLYYDDPVEIQAYGWLLAIAGDQAMLWGNMGAHLLPRGEVSIYGLGANDGSERLSEPLVETVHGSDELQLNTAETPWHAGWNIVALPWEVSELSPASKERLLALRPMAYFNGAALWVTEFHAGQAFWIHVDKVPEESLRLVYDVSADAAVGSVPDGKWQLSAPPAEWSAGWFWDGARFKPIEAPLPAGVGGWFLK